MAVRRRLAGNRRWTLCFAGRNGEAAMQGAYVISAYTEAENSVNIGTCLRALPATRDFEVVWARTGESHASCTRGAAQP